MKNLRKENYRIIKPNARIMLINAMPLDRNKISTISKNQVEHVNGA